jgi:hypothetical protein
VNFGPGANSTTPVTATYRGNNVEAQLDAEVIIETQSAMAAC